MSLRKRPGSHSRYSQSSNHQSGVSMHPEETPAYIRLQLQSLPPPQGSSFQHATGETSASNDSSSSPPAKTIAPSASLEKPQLAQGSAPYPTPDSASLPGNPLPWTESKGGHRARGPWGCQTSLPFLLSIASSPNQAPSPLKPFFDFSWLKPATDTTTPVKR